MKIDMSLRELLAEADAIARDVQSAFSQLTAEQLNWKPNPDRWSVAQCLDHLIAVNNPMLTVIGQALNGTRPTRLFERIPFWAGLCGRMMVKALLPGGTQKFKAPPKGRPSASKLDPRIVHQFTAHQRDVAENIEAIESRGAANVVITSPFMSFITYSLLDAARIIVVHERRHFEQARRVMAVEGFPT